MKISGKIKKIKTEKGFSMMEVMISVFVLAVGLLATLALIAGSMKRSMDNRSRVIATSLAQEGVELARSVRDNNWVKAEGETDYVRPIAFDTNNADYPAYYRNVTFPMNASSACLIGNIAAPLPGIDCSVGTGEYRMYLTPNGFYVHGAAGNSETKFQRKIVVSYYDENGGSVAGVADAKKTQIESMATWGYAANVWPATCNFSKSCISVKDTLTDWKAN